MLFILCTTLFQVRRFLYIYYTWETLLVMFLRTFRRRRPQQVLHNWSCLVISLMRTMRHISQLKKCLGVIEEQLSTKELSVQGDITYT
jgi:hypothetical protein